MEELKQKEKINIELILDILKKVANWVADGKMKPSDADSIREIIEIILDSGLIEG